VGFRLKAFFRPYGAGLFPTFTHGSRRGLHCCAVSRLIDAAEELGYSLFRIGFLTSSAKAAVDFKFSWLG
jgi:hypothetical protein